MCYPYILPKSAAASFQLMAPKIYGAAPRDCTDVETAPRYEWSRPSISNQTIFCGEDSKDGTGCAAGDTSTILNMYFQFSSEPPFFWHITPSLVEYETERAPNNGVWMRAPNGNTTVGYCFPYPVDSPTCQLNIAGIKEKQTVHGTRRFRCIVEWTADDIKNPSGYMESLKEGCRNRFAASPDDYLACTKRPFIKYCQGAVQNYYHVLYRNFCDGINGYKSWRNDDKGKWVQDS